MALWALDLLESGVFDVLRQLLLLRKREETIGLDAQHKRGLLDLAQSLGNGLGPVSRDIVCVKLSRDRNVAVAVETIDEFLSLVPQIRLSREVGRCGYLFTPSEILRLRPMELRVRRLLSCTVNSLRRAALARLCAVARSSRGGRPAQLVAIVVDVEVGLRWCAGPWALPDCLSPRRIRNVAAKAGLKGVPTTVRQESRHSRSSKPGRWRVVERVVAIIILGVGVDALSLCLAPADAPGAVLA